MTNEIKLVNRPAYEEGIYIFGKDKNGASFDVFRVPFSAFYKWERADMVTYYLRSALYNQTKLPEIYIMQGIDIQLFQKTYIKGMVQADIRLFLD